MNDNYNDYRREMVLLHVPFQSEKNDIIAENKFIQIYDYNKDKILERRKEFESNLDVEKTLDICKQLCRENVEEQEDELRAVEILHELLGLAQFFCLLIFFVFPFHFRKGKFFCIQILNFLISDPNVFLKNPMCLQTHFNYILTIRYSKKR